MKKLATYIFLLSAQFMGCGSAPTHDVQYIVLSNRLDAKFAGELRSTFFNYRDPEGHGLTQFLPDTVRKVSFLIYHPYTENVGDTLGVDFRASDDKARRGQLAENFLKKLTLSADSSGAVPNQDVLHQLAKIIDGLEGIKGECTVIVYGSLVQNSAGPIKPQSTSNKGDTGDFNFCDGDHNISGSDLDAATAQLSDSTSWIFRHIIKPARANAAIKNNKIQFLVDIETPDYIQSSNGRYPDEIKQFWMTLLGKMGVHATGGSFDTSEIQGL